MLDFLDPKTIYTIFHIFGVIVGAGGAFFSDAIFFRSIKDGHISKEEFGFMRLGSVIVWIGLILIVVSGFFIFMTNPEGYISSSKFLAKMSIVLVIIINGIIFHFMHFPHIRGHIGLKFHDSPIFIKKSSLLMISGGISFSSWVFAVVLGVINSVPYNYFQIMSIYFLVLLVIVMSAVFSKRFLFNFR